MSGGRAFPAVSVATVVNALAALAGVAVLVALVLLAGAQASLPVSTGDDRPPRLADDPRLVTAPRQPEDPAPTLPAPPEAPPADEPRPCAGPDLVARIDDVSDSSDRADGQRRVGLTWLNVGRTPCRLDGFPVVDLLGAGGPEFGFSRFGSDLVAERDDGPGDARPGPVDVAPGESARSVLRWTPPGAPGVASGRQPWTPDRVVVAFPGQGGNQTLPWRYGPVLAPADLAEARSDVSFGPVGPG